MPDTDVTFERRVADARLVVDERFAGRELDRSHWIPSYLPHWAGRDHSAARYRLVGDHLELFIADDQPVWRPDVAPDMRVSSLQTGCFAGPIGSAIGQHRTDDRLLVVEEQTTERLITPYRGAVELQASWAPHPNGMVALWMIGFEDRPERSAEICVCEIFGSDVSADRALVGMGLHPFADPSVIDDFEKVEAAIRIADPHRYGMIWTDTDVTFFLDGDPVKRVDQSPNYPMQLMLNIYEFGARDGREDPTPPAGFRVDHVKVWASTGDDRS